MGPVRPDEESPVLLVLNFQASDATHNLKAEKLVVVIQAVGLFWVLVGFTSSCFLSLTAAMWSLGGIFIKLISWSPFLIAGIRSGIAGSIMAIYMAATHTRFKLNRYSALAGVGLGLSATLFTISNKLTTAANAIVLQYTAPIFILIITALFFKQ